MSIPAVRIEGFIGRALVPHICVLERELRRAPVPHNVAGCDSLVEQSAGHAYTIEIRAPANLETQVMSGPNSRGKHIGSGEVVVSRITAASQIGTAAVPDAGFIGNTEAARRQAALGDRANEVDGQKTSTHLDDLG